GLNGRREPVPVRAYDGGGHTGRFEYLNVCLLNKNRADLGAHLPRAVRVLFGEPDPLNGRMARRNFAAEQAYTATADNGEANTLGRFLHWFTPARNLCLNSAMAEIVSLVSGKSTGSFRSAERSAAL